MQNGNEVTRGDIAFVFRLLAGGQFPFIAFAPSSSMRACAFASAFKRTSLRPASTFRLRLTGASKRFRTGEVLERLIFIHSI